MVMKSTPILFYLLSLICLEKAAAQVTGMGHLRYPNHPSCDREIPPCDPSEEYRSHDGSCNNLAHPGWGMADTAYSRLLRPRYADGLQVPRTAVDGSILPSARKVRTSLFPTGQIEDDQRTLMAMQWGQLVAHDMSFLTDHDETSDCCSRDGKTLDNPDEFCFPIKVPSADATMGRAGIRCMNFTRSVTDKEHRMLARK